MTSPTPLLLYCFVFFYLSNFFELSILFPCPLSHIIVFLVSPSHTHTFTMNSAGLRHSPILLFFFHIYPFINQMMHFLSVFPART